MPSARQMQLIKNEVLRLSAFSQSEVDEINNLIDVENKIQQQIRYDQLRREQKSGTKKEQSGYVYLVRDVFRGCYKIGFTTSLKSRIEQLKIANAGIEYLRHYAGTIGDEKRLHATFDGVKVSGEWFRLTELHLSEIDAYFSKSNSCIQ